MISSFVADVLKPVLLETPSSLHHSKNAAPMSTLGQTDIEPPLSDVRFTPESGHC
jgi:hypothetical protein